MTNIVDNAAHAFGLTHIHRERRGISLKRSLAMLALISLPIESSCWAQSAAGLRVADIKAGSFPSSLNVIVTSGYDAAHDLGAGCTFIREVVNDGTGLGAIKDVSGQYWDLTPDRPISVGCFGAKGDGTSSDHAAIQAALSSSYKDQASGVRYFGPEVFFPCGRYVVNSLYVLTQPSQNNRIIRGSGFCTTLVQSSSNAGNDIIVIQDGGTSTARSGAMLISDLAFQSQSAKTGGAAIAAKQSSKLELKNLWSLSGGLYNGVTLDGVDNVRLSHLTFDHVSNIGILAYDGFDCGGFSPVTLQTTASSIVPAGTTTFSFSSTSGVVAGETVYQATATNSGPLGKVASVTSTTVTLQSGSTSAVPANGKLTFGQSCNGANLTITDDTAITNSGAHAVEIGGGVGGVFLSSAHLYTSAQYGLYITHNPVIQQTNREIFLGPDVDIDSNVHEGLYVDQNSITRLTATGAWIVASQNGGAVRILKQLPNSIPADGGAFVQFTGGVVGVTGNGSGIRWEDTGTLNITGVDISYNSTNAIEIASGSSTGDVTITNNKLRKNGNYGVSIIGTPPTGMSFIGNSWTSNSLGAVNGVSTSNSTCVGNRGGSGQC